jgi:hypothetical protein
MERAVTPHEAAVVGWLLDHASMGDVAAYRLHPPEELRVVEGCKCGCPSLDFAPNAWVGAGIIADASIVYSDGQKTDLILWGREGEIVLLEVVDYDPRLPHRFPQLSDLRTWEEHRQAQP